MITSCLTLRGEARLHPHRHRDVGQRADGQDRHLPGVLHHRAAPGSRRRSWLSSFLAVAKPPGGAGAGSLAYQPPCRVVSHVGALVQQRGGGALVDRNLGAAGHLEDLQHVGRGDVHAAVAGDGGDAEDVELGRVEHEEQRHRVVLRREREVGVEDDLLGRLRRGRHGGSSARRTRSTTRFMGSPSSGQGGGDVVSMARPRIALARGVRTRTSAPAAPAATTSRST